MPQAELHAHSLAEANLYLSATACPRCGSGPLASAHVEDESLDERNSFKRTEVGLCAACGAEHAFVFRIPASTGADAADYPTLNPGEKPSQIIDVGQWIMLARTLTDRARKASEASLARRLNVQAAQCLGEALKFYDDPENDLPPPEAFFCAPSRERFRIQPLQFSRQRLLHERSRLPTVPGMGGGSGGRT